MTAPEGERSGVLADDQVGRRVVFGGALRVAGFVAANLLTVAAAVILLRYLGVAGFGRYGTVLALLGVIHGVSDAGLTATGSRELALARSADEARDIHAHIVGLRIVLTSAGVVCAVLFALVAGYDGDQVAGTALGGLGVLLTSIQSALLIPLAVEMRNGAVALNDVIRQAVLVISFAVLVALEAGVVWFLAAQIVVGLVALAIVPALMPAPAFVAPRWTAARLRALGTIALPVAVATVLGVLYLRVLVVEMSLLSDDEQELGYFVTSTRIVEVVGGLPFLVMSVVLPVVSVAARDDRRRLVYITGRTTEVMALSGMLIAVMIWALAEPILVSLAGEEYRPAAPALQIQAFAAITLFLGAAWQPALFGMGRIRSLVLALAIGLVTLLVSGMLLIPVYEAEGAAVAALLGEATVAVMLFVGLLRAGREPWVRASVLARITLAGAIAVAIAALTPGPDVVAGVCAGVGFCAAAWGLRTVPSELTDAAQAVLRRGRPRPAG